jgi:hypothetical protein
MRSASERIACACSCIHCGVATDFICCSSSATRCVTPACCCVSAAMRRSCSPRAAFAASSDFCVEPGRSCVQ